MINVAMIIEGAARAYPHKTALLAGGQTWTFDDLNRAANQVANGLCAAGIGPGDRVALTCGNTWHFPVAYYGILKTGAVVIPMNTLYRRKEISACLAQCGARGYICAEGDEALPMGAEAREALANTPSCQHLWLITNESARTTESRVKTWEDLVGGQAVTFDTCLRSGSDIASIIFTSGTTGNAKGAALTHGNITMHTPVLSDIFRYSHEDVALVVAPLYHTIGHAALMNAGYYRGMSLVFLPRFDPSAVLEAMQRHEVSVFAGVPTMYQLLCQVAEGTGMDTARLVTRLRVGLIGGSAAPPGLIDRTEALFGITLLEGYGLTECTGGACLSRLDRKRPRGSVGTPVWGCDVRIVDPNGSPLPPRRTGEIIIRGHNVMQGYYDAPDATAQVLRQGWLYTGDVGRFDEEGNLYIVDRTKDLIIRGGRNVFPREVEEFLAGHPSVAQVAVLGVPDELLGEEILAVIVPKPSAQIQGADLVAWAKEHLPAHMYPRFCAVYADLPLGPTGKVLKEVLRDSYLKLNG